MHSEPWRIPISSSQYTFICSLNRVASLNSLIETFSRNRLPASALNRLLSPSLNRASLCLYNLASLRLDLLICRNLKRPAGPVGHYFFKIQWTNASHSSMHTAICLNYHLLHPQSLLIFIFPTTMMIAFIIISTFHQHYFYCFYSIWVLGFGFWSYNDGAASLKSE